MKYFLKSALKVLTNYAIVVTIFAVFLVTVLSMAKDNFGFWLVVYCFVMFLFLTSILYSDMWKLAVKEKKPQYGYSHYPLKGFVYGLVGFSPIILIGLIYPLVNFGNEFYDRAKHLLFNTLLGPVYGFISLGGEAWWAYAGAILIVPVIAGLGYLAGYYSFELRKRKPVASQVKKK